jgi:hypothetical protein
MRACDAIMPDLARLWLRRWMRDTAEAPRRNRLPPDSRCLAEDKVRPKKQQHTSKRIFERLRDEHGFPGGMTSFLTLIAATGVK